jgi:hypothetical protein
MLFMQLAVAAYACPQLDVGSKTARTHAMMGSAPHHAMSCCDKPDPVQPSLCHAHGEVGKQSLDKPELPPIPPFSAVGMAIPLIPSVAFDAGTSPPASVASLTRTTAPPLSIRHCCFRI